MTTSQKVKFLQVSQEIADLNKKLLEAANEITETEEAEDILLASQKLIQAQSNIIKATNK